MDGENLTSIRKRSKAQGWIDSYWFSIDGVVNPEPKKIQEVPREGQVFVMNIQDMSQTWIQYLYPELYKKLKKEATERENILRRKEDDLRRREENREIRKKVMLEVQLLRLIKLDFLVSERMPDETISEIAEVLYQHNYTTNQVYEYVCQYYPKFALTKQTTKRKLAEAKEESIYEQPRLLNYKSYELPEGSGNNPTANSFIILYKEGIRDWDFLLSLDSNQTRVFHEARENIQTSDYHEHNSSMNETGPFEPKVFTQENKMKESLWGKITKLFTKG